MLEKRQERNRIIVPLLEIHAYSELFVCVENSKVCKKQKALNTQSFLNPIISRTSFKVFEAFSRAFSAPSSKTL